MCYSAQLGTALSFPESTKITLSQLLAGGFAMLIATMILTVAMGIPTSRTESIEVDLVEVNYVENEDGRIVFHQMILWTFSEERGKLEVTDWISGTANDKKWTDPAKNHNTNLFVTVVRIGKRTFLVRSRNYVVTYGYDSEMHDRNFLESDFRKHFLK